MAACDPCDQLVYYDDRADKNRGKVADRSVRAGIRRLQTTGKQVYPVSVKAQRSGSIIRSEKQYKELASKCFTEAADTRKKISAGICEGSNYLSIY